MRILVLGASGYIGSRLVPRLLADGHEVVATTSKDPDPGRFAWGDRVLWRRCDIGDTASVAAAFSGVDAVCFLVHTLDRPGYGDRDRAGAINVREAAEEQGVQRIVYLSGLVPDQPREQLSAHITSRLEVEEELAAAACSTLTLRAGVVVGAGSTSFEVVRHVASLLIVQPVPRWMNSRVQPVAASDVIEALATELATGSTPGGAPGHEGELDLGGPDVISYPALLRATGRSLGLVRTRVPVLAAPMPIVALASALLSTAPFWTVASLVESLRHDMVCRPHKMWTRPDAAPLLGLREAIDLAVNAPVGSVPEAALPSDPAWTRATTGAPVSLRAGVRVLRHRLATLPTLADWSRP